MIYPLARFDFHPALADCAVDIVRPVGLPRPYCFRPCPEEACATPWVVFVGDEAEVVVRSVEKFSSAVRPSMASRCSIQEEFLGRRGLLPARHRDLLLPVSAHVSLWFRWATNAPDLRPPWHEQYYHHGPSHRRDWMEMMVCAVEDQLDHVENLQYFLTSACLRELVKEYGVCKWLEGR